MTSLHDLRWLGRSRMGARLIRDRDRDADSARLGARRPTRTPAHSRLYRLSALCPLFERQSRQVVNVACMSSIKGLVESCSTPSSKYLRGIWAAYLSGIRRSSLCTRDHAHTRQAASAHGELPSCAMRDIYAPFQRMRGNRSC